MVAREILESQVRPFAAHGVEKHRGPESSVWPGFLVVNGEEGRETVGGILLESREREVQLVDESMTQLVAQDELVAPHVQNISCEVVLRDGSRCTFAGGDLREELDEDVVGRLREGGRPPDFSTVHIGGRIVQALGKLIGDDDLEVFGERYCFGQTVHHSFEHARIPDLLYCVPVLGLDGVILINNRGSALALSCNRRGVAAGARRADHY